MYVCMYVTYSLYTCIYSYLIYMRSTLVSSPNSNQTFLGSFVQEANLGNDMFHLLLTTILKHHLFCFV